jgi:hypothetical protein
LIWKALGVGLEGDEDLDVVVEVELKFFAGCDAMKDWKRYAFVRQEVKISEPRRRTLSYERLERRLLSTRMISSLIGRVWLKAICIEVSVNSVAGLTPKGIDEPSLISSSFTFDGGRVSKS